MGERVESFRRLGRLLAPGGVLVVITTAATGGLSDRHVDLLLRAQEGRVGLPDVGALAGQLAAAGLHADRTRRIPGEPRVGLTATRA